MNTRLGWVFLVVSAFYSFASNATEIKLYTCTSAALRATVKISDYGGYDGTLDKFDAQFEVKLRSSGAVLLSGTESGDAFVKNDWGWPTYHYDFAYNPEGGDADPLLSIWLITNDTDHIKMKYWREPYPNHNLDCTLKPL